MANRITLTKFALTAMPVQVVNEIEKIQRSFPRGYIDEKLQDLGIKVLQCSANGGEDTGWRNVKELDNQMGYEPLKYRFDPDPSTPFVDQPQ